MKQNKASHLLNEIAWMLESPLRSVPKKKKKEPVAFLTMAARYCEILGFRKQAPLPCLQLFRFKNVKPETSTVNFYIDSTMEIEFLIA